jgi:hypothetical protein
LIENNFLKKIIENNFLKNIFQKISRNSRKKNSNSNSWYYDNFGILTTKMYTKLASIEMNDEILSKVVGILGTKLVNKL